MNREINVGIVGEYNPAQRYHVQTEEALHHAANTLAVSITCTWVPTGLLGRESAAAELRPYDAVFGAPCDYKSVSGALAAFTYARETRRPFLAT